MNTANDIEVLVNDLAAHWTEPTLQTLHAAGFREVSVGMELKTWQTLKKLLHSEMRWQHAFPHLTIVSPSTFKEHVVRRAAVLVARKFEPESVTSKFKTRVRVAAGKRQSTSAERRLYAGLVRRPASRAAFEPSSRPDFAPRFRVSALGRQREAVLSL